MIFYQGIPYTICTNVFQIYNFLKIQQQMLTSYLLNITLIMLVFGLIEAKYYSDFQQIKVGSSNGPQNLQANQCVYGGGTINNSTVIQLGNCGQSLYFIQLALGSNNQVFGFQFDTGSDVLWIPIANSSNQTGFNAGQSTSFNLSTQGQAVTYADGSSVSGNLGTDNIIVSQTNISLIGSILFGSNITGMGFPTSVSGLVGMGYSTIANFLDIAYKQSQIKSPVFSLDLNLNTSTSYLYYNNGLPTVVSQNTYWISQYQSGHWQVDLIGMFVGGVEFTSIASDSAIIDSGTSIFYLNQDLYSAVVQQFFTGPGCTQDTNGNSYCPCNSNTSWPNMSFMFIGVQVFIPGSAYKKQVTSNGLCVAAFGTILTVSSILLGDTFFREYTISFDKPNSRMGFYGNTKQIFVFDSQFFLTSQYVMTGLMGSLTIVGVVICIYNRVMMRKTRIQQNLGVELM